jgi:hypothetical protein
MDPDKLFLVRCQEVASLLDTNDEIKLLDLSRLIRQLMIDDQPLVGVVNRKPQKIGLSFRVGAFTYRPDKYTAFMSLEDGVDPKKRYPGAPVVTLNQGEFLNHPVIYSHPFEVTIKQVVQYISNVAGGIHYDPIPKKKHAVMARLSQRVLRRGFSMGIVMLRDISTVMLRGLEPLIKNVEARNA